MTQINPAQSAPTCEHSHAHDFGVNGPGMAFVAVFRDNPRSAVWHIEHFGAGPGPYNTQALCGYLTGDHLLRWLSGFCEWSWPGLSGALRGVGIGTLDAPDRLCLRCRDSWLRWYGGQCIDVEEASTDDL